MPKPARTSRSHSPLVALSMIPSALGILLPLILARLLTPAEIGTFKIFFLYLGVAPALFLTSGLRNGIAYWAGQDVKRSSAIETSSMLILLLAATGTMLTLTLTNRISSTFSVADREVHLFAISLLGGIAGSYFEEAAIAVGRVWTGALFYCGSEVLRTLAIISTLLYYRSLSAVLITHTAVSTLKLLIGYLCGYKIGVVGFSWTPSILKDVWAYALPVSLAYIFGVLIASSDQFLLASRITASEFALYSIGCLSIAPLLTFEQSVSRVLIPQMAEAFAKKNAQRAAVLYQSAVDTLGFVIFPAVTGLCIFGTPIIELLFTERYSAAARYLKIFALSYLLLIIPHDAVARSRGQARWIFCTFVAFGTSSLLFAYLLIPAAGPMGALAGVLISGTAMRIYSVCYSRRVFALRLQELLPISTWARYITVCLILAAAAYLIQPHFETPRRWLLGAGSLFSGAYLCLALPMKNRERRRRNGAQSVLILTQSVNIGGLERMILHLSRYLQKDSHWHVRVLAYDHSSEKQSIEAAFRDAEIPLEVFQKKDGFSFRVVFRILRTIYREDIHIIHSQDLGTLIYAVLAKFLSLGKVSIVHTQHSFPRTEDTLRYRLYRHLFSLGIDSLSVVSEDIRVAYSKVNPKGRDIRLIENGVEFATSPTIKRGEKIRARREFMAELSPEQRQQLTPFANDVWILYQARFFPQKGQEHALRIWTEMRAEERQKSILCLIGPESVAGEYGRIRSLIRGCPDQQRILMLGASPIPLRWLQVGDVFLSCSEYEGMPLAPLEAAGCGLPLVISDIPGHSFLKDMSFQFTLDNIQQAAQEAQALINRILSGDERYQHYLWEKSEAIRTRFSVARMATQYALLYARSTD